MQKGKLSIRLNNQKVTVNVFKSLQFLNLNIDVDECFQVDVCIEIIDVMFRSLTCKDVLEYA